MAAIPLTGPYLPTFVHAAGLLDDLADEVGRCCGIACVCSQGWSHDLTVFTGDDAAPAAAVDWAWCVAADDPSVLAMVLLSVEARLDAVAAADLAWFCEAAGELATDGIELTDWVRTDGEVLWSTAGLLGIDRPGWMV